MSQQLGDLLIKQHPNSHRSRNFFSHLTGLVRATFRGHCPLSRSPRRNSGRRDLSRLSFPGYVESRIAPLCPPRSYPRAFGKGGRGWNSFRSLIFSRAKCRAGRNVYVRVCTCVCARARARGEKGGLILWWSYRRLASCLMSANSSYAECRALRDRFDKSCLENSKTCAFISRASTIRDCTLRASPSSRSPSIFLRNSSIEPLVWKLNINCQRRNQFPVIICRLS